MPKRKGKPACEFANRAYHSDDRVTVYFGQPQPIILCGYHASPGWIKSALASVKDSRNAS